MQRTCDVLIVGGGIMGLSSAYYLLKTGKRVILVEKHQIGSGASGACDDMILLQSKKPGIHLELAIESLEMYRGLSGELGADIGFENRGGMIFIENERQLAIMEEFVEQQREYGLDVRIVDKKEVRKRQPYVREGIIASTYSDKDSQVNPLKVVKSFMARGLSMGLQIIRGVNIDSIEQKANCWEVRLDSGDVIDTEYLVNAAGAWAPQVGELVGIEIPISPRRGQIAITEQIPQIGDTNVWSAEYIVSKLKPELRSSSNNVYNTLGIGFAVSQTSEGNYIIGSTRENAGYDKSTTFEALSIIVNQAVKFFPIFKKVNIIRSFAGLRPASSDGKAIIGEVENKRGFFIAAGHEGDGVALAPITGRLISDMINGRSVSYNMNELNLKRFDKKSVRKEAAV